MRCLNCNQIIDDNVDVCPICGSSLVKEESNSPVIFEDDDRQKFLDAILSSEKDSIVEESDLPVLNANSDNIIELDAVDTNLSDNEEEFDYQGVEVKDEFDDVLNNENELDLEKTRQVSLFDDDDELSLTGLINQQIENTNIDVDNNDVIEPVGNLDEIKPYDVNKEDVDANDNSSEEDDFSSEESVDNRKHTLIVAFIIMVLIIVGGFCALYYLDNNKVEEQIVLNSSNAEEVYNNYLNSKDESELKSLLKDIRNNKDEITKTQKEFKNIFDKKIDSVIAGDYNSISSFNTEMNKVKSSLSDIYSITDTNSEGTVRLLNNEDYNSLMSDIEDGTNNAKPYFEAIDYYNSKSYDEAYTMFSKIELDSVYYSKASSYMDKIIDDVLAILNNDIAKIANDVDSLSDDEKLITYSQIQDIILLYDSTYENLNLDNNSEYLNILNKYNDLVNQYSN